MVRMKVEGVVKIVICPQCKKEGKRSRVYPGFASTTLVYYPPFYDEEGQFHNHDGNITTTEYRCSNGHEWTEKSSGECWCGWKGMKDG